MNAIIELNNVTKIYRRSHLGRVTQTTGVADLDLRISSGEVFGLLGLNGAGKTTAIKLLLGLHYPTRGEVRILGKLMPDLEVLRRVGYLPEAAYLNKYLTGRETMKLFGALSKIPKKELRLKVDEILSKVGMQKAADKRISEYSKGMLQRISIAQALVHDPDILIFDEPITGLDPLAIQEIRHLVLWLKQNGKTVFFSSHSISEVEKVCDRIGIVAGGRLIKVMEQSAWKGREGHLEELFASLVQRSDAVGSIKFF